MADCPGSGVVVDDPIEDDGIVCHPCPVCWAFLVVEPVEPEGLAPRWKIVDHPGVDADARQRHACADREARAAGGP